MPLPTPNEGETEQTFISRCMSNETALEDFPDQEQRAAVCYRQWRENKALSTDDAGSMVGTDVGDGETHLCVCPECGAEKRVPLGQKCNEVRCPECSAMMRQETPGKATDTTTADEVAQDSTQPVPVENSDTTNALKAVSRTDAELRAANYIILFGGRDLEGVGSPRVNADGSTGEYFTKTTNLDSFYTRHGTVLMDWEHGQGELGDEVLGVVDWKTARVDDKGVFVERVLNRRNRYVRWLEELGWFDNGTLGTSSHAEPDNVEKASDGAIIRWPLMRDTITVQPMEPRMLAENQLQAFKALGLPVPNDTDTNEAGPEQEQEASPEVEAGRPSAVDVARAKAHCQQFLISLMEE